MRLIWRIHALLWLGEGKSVWEIFQLLGIGEQTIWDSPRQSSYLVMPRA
jgi:hypothetical protein